MEQQDKLERLAAASIATQSCPSVERLAAYVLRTLSGTDQLIISAHLRLCPLCAYDVKLMSYTADLPNEWPVKEGVLSRIKVAIARLVPPPSLVFRDEKTELPSAANLDKRHERQYVVADLKITVTIAPLKGEHWRVTGQVKRAGVTLAGSAVTLRTRRQTPLKPTTTDADGFFTFERVPTGRYTLTTIDEGVQVQIRDLELIREQP